MDLSRIEIPSDSQRRLRDGLIPHSLVFTSPFSSFDFRALRVGHIATCTFPTGGVVEHFISCFSLFFISLAVPFPEHSAHVSYLDNRVDP